MKKFGRVIALAFSICTALMFGGCAFYDAMAQVGDAVDSFGDATLVENVKVLSKPMEYEFVKPFADYSTKIVEDLVSYFATAEANDNLSNLSIDLSAYGATQDNEPYVRQLLATDRIRGQFVIRQDVDPDGTGYIYRLRQFEPTDSASFKWNWYVDFDIGDADLDNVQISLLTQNLYELFFDNIVRYYIDYVNLYSIALEINLYRLIIGETPLTITPQYNAETGETILLVEGYGSSDAIRLTNTRDGYEVDRSTCAPLVDTLERYNSKGTYVGVTEYDRERITEYILDDVIGARVVNSSECNIFLENEYETVVREIVDRDPSLTEVTDEDIVYTKSFFDPYPASFLQDYEANNFYIGSGVDENGLRAENQFDHIPWAEYQSMILSLREETPLSMIMLTLYSEIDMNVTIRIRYYDHSSHMLYELGVQNVAVRAGDYDAGTDTLMIDLTGQMGTGTEITTPVDVVVGEFDDSMEDGVLRSTEGKPIDSTTAKYYKIIQSRSGFGAIGVFDESMANSSYLELAFDIEKTAESEYMPFKVCLVAVIEGE